LGYYTGTRTACTRPNISTNQVNIPVQDVFWNPPIVRGRPSTVGYTVAVTTNFFTIDLYQIQRKILQNQYI
jgi:hypothetical protein